MICNQAPLKQGSSQPIAPVRPPQHSSRPGLSATGALSIIDAAAGIADSVATTAEASRASALLAHTEAVGAAAATSVATLVAIDETNAKELGAVATGV